MHRMIEQLIHIDQQALLAINHCHAPWADTLMWYVSQSWVWLPLYAVLIFLLFRRFGWRQALVFTLAIGAAVGLSDMIAHLWIKPTVCRFRPTHEPAIMDQVQLVHDYAGGLYGFVSNHAANTMACALMFCWIYRNKTATLCMMTWVALNCYSRMYLGVHYPGDILGGLIMGSLVASVVFALLRAWEAAAWCPFGAEGDGARDSSADS